MKTLCIFLLLTGFSIGYAQKPIEKRKAFSLKIAASETQQYVADIPEGPYFVKDKVLQLYCGEKVFVECEIAGDSISSMKVVPQNNYPKKTIVISFTQEAEDRKNIMTVLNLNNPFDKDLYYQAFMLTPANDKWRSTSTLPIVANLESFESWPHAVISLALSHWKLK